MKKLINLLKRFVVNDRRWILAAAIMSLIIQLGFLEYLEIFYSGELFKSFMCSLTDNTIENYNIMFIMGFASGSIISIVVFFLCFWFSSFLSNIIFNLIGGFISEP